MNSDFSRSSSRSNSRSLSPSYIRLGRFELLKRLAAGGMAEIFLAREYGGRGYKNAVAIKRIHPHLAEQDRFVEMFLQEAKIAQKLNHKNIVQIVELGEADGEFFIAMEYVLGCSLRQLMREVAKQKVDVPIDVCIEMILQSCAGLHQAHELTNRQGKLIGLVHRDISPHNLMLTYDGVIKLLDFGIAKATETMLETTRTGVLKGKLHYMSPEQCRQSRDLDRRSDIFSLGIVLWELFTGRRLFKRESDLETMQSIVSGKMWDVREFRPDVPDAVAEVVNHALQTDREDRFDSCEEMRIALKNAATASGVLCEADTVMVFLKSVFGDSLTNERAEIEEILEQQQHEKSLSLLNDRSLGLKNHARSGMSQSKSLDTSLVLQKNTQLFAAEKRDDKLHEPPEFYEETYKNTAKGALNAEDTNFIRHQRQNILISVGIFTATTIVSFVLVMSLLYWFFADQKPLKPTIVQIDKELVQADLPTLRMIWPPVFEEQVMLKDLENFKKHLEKELSTKVTFTVAKSYVELITTLDLGAADFAWMPPYLFLKAQQQNPKADILLSTIPAKRSENYAILVAKSKESNIHLEAFVGKTFCYPDKSSTSGYLYASYYFQKLGYSASRDFKFHRSGNHLQVLEDIKNDVCQFGGSYSGVFEFAEQQGVSVQGLEKIAKTGVLATEMIVASSKVSPNLKNKFHDVLLAIDRQDAVKMSALNLVRGFAEKDMAKIEKMSEKLRQFERLTALKSFGKIKSKKPKKRKKSKKQ